MDDLEPDERALHRVLARTPPVAPPIGFRDAVMSRVREQRTVWEWVIAAILAVPSLAFLGWQLVENGDDFVDGSWLRVALTAAFSFDAAW